MHVTVLNHCLSRAGDENVSPSSPVLNFYKPTLTSLTRMTVCITLKYMRLQQPVLLTHLRSPPCQSSSLALLQCASTYERGTVSR